MERKRDRGGELWLCYGGCELSAKRSIEQTVRDRQRQRQQGGSPTSTVTRCSVPPLPSSPNHTSITRHTANVFFRHRCLRCGHESARAEAASQSGAGGDSSTAAAPPLPAHPHPPVPAEPALHRLPGRTAARVVLLPRRLRRGGQRRPAAGASRVGGVLRAQARPAAQGGQEESEGGEAGWGRKNRQ